MPIYVFKNPKTGKIFEEIRPFSKMNDPFYDEDGTKCDRVEVPGGSVVIDNNAEVFEKDNDYVKKCKPKYVKFRDGHKERYDPTRHC